MSCSSLTYAAPDMQIFNQAKAAGKEVFQVIQRKPSSIDGSKEKTLEDIEGHINIQKVHFAYPSRPHKLILQDFTLSIPAGQSNALVGSSGCGKSTVISLITRFYDPLQGMPPPALFLFIPFLLLFIVMSILKQFFFRRYFHRSSEHQGSEPEIRQGKHWNSFPGTCTLCWNHQG